MPTLAGTRRRPLLTRIVRVIRASWLLPMWLGWSLATGLKIDLPRESSTENLPSYRLRWILWQKMTCRFRKLWSDLPRTPNFCKRWYQRTKHMIWHICQVKEWRTKNHLKGHTVTTTPRFYPKDSHGIPLKNSGSSKDINIINCSPQRLKSFSSNFKLSTDSNVEHP